MALARLDVLTVNATVIIGLLILLTFQSISSAFIETESQNFLGQLSDSDRLLIKYDRLIEFCEEAVTDPDSFEQGFKDLVLYDALPNELFYIQEIERELDPELFSEFREKCKEWEIKRIDIITTRIALEGWGLDYGYLDEFYAESDYFNLIVAGAFWVNLTNLVMIFPFLVSAMITSINMVRKKGESERASTAAILSMAIGFGIMIVGLIIIISIFYAAYIPFL